MITETDGVRFAARADALALMKDGSIAMAYREIGLWVDERSCGSRDYHAAAGRINRRTAGRLESK
jgi:hypothetical protein